MPTGGTIFFFSLTHRRKYTKPVTITKDITNQKILYPTEVLKPVTALNISQIMNNAIAVGNVSTYPMTGMD